MTDNQSLDPIKAFTDMGRIKPGNTSIDQVLHHIAELAKRTSPDASEVSVTLSQGKGPTTPPLISVVASSQ